MTTSRASGSLAKNAPLVDDAVSPTGVLPQQGLPGGVKFWRHGSSAAARVVFVNKVQTSCKMSRICACHACQCSAHVLQALHVQLSAVALRRNVYISFKIERICRAKISAGQDDRSSRLHPEISLWCCSGQPNNP